MTRRNVPYQQAETGTQPPATDRAASSGPGFRLAIPIFVVTLVVVAVLGVVNQGLYAEQLALMAQKEQLLASVAEARPHAAAVNGPQVVSAWASVNGMVPIPEAREALLIAPAPAPVYSDPLPSLELRTLWR